MSNLQKIRTRNFKLINLLTILVWFGCVCLYSQDNRHKTNADTFTRPFSQCWDFFVNQNPEIEFASDNVKELFLPTLDGKLVALNYNYGEKLWETDLGGEIISTPLSDADRVYIAVSYDNNQNDDPVMISKKEGVDKRTGNQRRTVIRSLDKTTGLTYWESEFQFDFTSEKKLYLYPFRKFLVLVADNGDVHSIDKSSGQIVWKKRLRLNFSSIPFQEEEKIFFGVSDKRLVSLSLATGEIIRGINTVSPPTAVVNDKIRGNLIWGDKRGTIYSFDTESRKFNWYFRKGAEISSIVFTERGILTTSLDNFIYLN
ncbi:MAG TPA: PQQ-binding-like beta-propeller repeat protein, partial [Pyrinomonadaceae bacterium]|nr:PQQ-binding-like beta-propeller repeat protein [Pyrinomonadaceae bacterium]